MSSPESDSDVDLTEYRSSQGMNTRTADVSSDEHAVRARFGDDEDQKAFEFDAEIIAERIAGWYDSEGAAIREYLSNAETACIRRARMELRSIGIEPPQEVTELLEMAREKCDYEPLVEVTYNRKSDETRLVIEDNGCGITTEEYQVLRNIGYSASHDEGDRLGQFGMGILSFAQLTGTRGAVKFDTHSFPADDRSEDVYSILMYVTNLEYLDGGPDGYGTRFEFPDFCESAKRLNIPSTVDEYADGMRVPVLYRDFDESGQETPRSDDFLPRNIEDDYSDDSLIVTYEDEFFKAVMSPDTPVDRRSGDLVTYNVTMPIRRNTDTFGDTPKFDAPWTWDFRGKREDGPIVKCDSDESLEGLVPAEDTKYETMTDRQQERHVRQSEVPDDAIEMPQPASSRDSYMSGHDSFWQHVSERLMDEWGEIAAERFVDLDTWDDFQSMDRSEKEALFRAYSQFGPRTINNDPSNIQEQLEDAFGLTIPEDICEKLDKSRSKVLVVPRGHGQPHHKKPAKRNKMKIWEVIDDAPDGVYVGKSISKKKAEIAWGLGETHVLNVDGYDEYEDLWGFTKLKDLPHKDLKEKLPELDDDVAEAWESQSASSSSSSSSSKGNVRTSRDPTTKMITTRTGRSSPRRMDRIQVGDLVDRLESDKEFTCGNFATATDLIVYDQTDLSGRTTPPTKNASSNQGVAVTAVPNYVFKFLKGKPHVHESYDEYVKAKKQEAIDKFDVADVVLFSGGQLYERYGDDPDQFVEILNEYADADIDEDATAKVFDEAALKPFPDASEWDIDADAYSVNGGRRSREIREENFSLEPIDILFQQEVPDMDMDAPEFKQVFGRRKKRRNYLNASSDTVERGIEMIKAMGGRFPSQKDDN